MAPTKPKKTASPPRSEEPAASTVRVSRSGRSPERASARTLEKQAERMLATLGLEGAELSIALVDDATIHALNKAYRKKDKPTDVLSFAQHDDALSHVKSAQAKSPHAQRSQAQRSGAKGARAAKPSAAPGLLLGDVIVSLDTAARQAAERDRSLAAELTTLLAHGVLHLAGFDHRTDDEEREMNAYAAVLEAAALAKKPLRLTLRGRG